MDNKPKGPTLGMSLTGSIYGAQIQKLVMTPELKAEGDKSAKSTRNKLRNRFKLQEESDEAEA